MRLEGNVPLITGGAHSVEDELMRNGVGLSLLERQYHISWPMITFDKRVSTIALKKIFALPRGANMLMSLLFLSAIGIVLVGCGSAEVEDVAQPPFALLDEIRELREDNAELSNRVEEIAVEVSTLRANELKSRVDSAKMPTVISTLILTPTPIWLLTRTRTPTSSHLTVWGLDARNRLDSTKPPHD